MNRAYRLIWNERLGAWSVAPETASARGKRGGVRRSAAALWLTLAAGTNATLAADLAATALPGGARVTAGQASVSSSGVSMTIDQSSQRAIINWQGFDIGSQAQVRFRQPDAAAVALNRVSGVTASRIEGQLSANGQVFLVNPNGVLFGSGARVNVGALAVSTLNIRDADFLTGNYLFSGSGGSIVNQGRISTAPGGYVAFISPSISNDGSISAPRGTVAMGAGERVRLNFAGERLIGLDVSTETLDTLIANRQAIRAEGGAIVLSAAGAEAVTRSVVNNIGVLDAGSLTRDGGRIVLEAGGDVTLAAASTVTASGRKGGEIALHAQSGTLLADGRIEARGEAATGGSVQLLGRQVGLVNAAQVDASGALGGGTVLVGGDYQGGNPKIRNAEASFVGSGARIKADALQQGDGGKVIVWSDGTTRYFGSISARGGAQGGDGGLAEVSGKQNLLYAGQTNLGALAGRAGTLLLDPDNLFVTAAGAPAGAPGATEDSSSPFASTPTDAYVTVGSINATTGAVTLSAAQDIIFETSVALGTNPTSLAATAGRDIAMAGFGFTAVNAGTNVSLTATAGGVTNLGATDLNGGALTISSAGSSSATGVLSRLSLVKAGVGTLTLSGANTYLGATLVNDGTLVAASPTALGVGPVGTTVASGAKLTLANISTESPVTLAGGNLTGTGTAVLTGNVVLTASSTIAVDGSDNLALLGSTVGSAGQRLTKEGLGTLTLLGNNAHEGVTDVKAGTLVAAHPSALGTFTGGTVVAAEANLTIAGVSVGAEAVTLNGGAALTATGSASLSGHISLAADSTITVDGAGNSFGLGGGISGSLGIHKAGTGSLVLNGASTYSGVTHIDAGTLVVAHDTALGSAAGGTIVAAGANLTLSASEIVGEALTLNGGTALTTSGANALREGSVTLATADITLSLGAGGGLVLVNTVISGTAGLGINKADLGVLELSNPNTYTGATRISAGKLLLHPLASIATSSGVDVAAATATSEGGTFEIRSPKTIASLTGAGKTLLTGAGATLTIGDAVSNMPSTYGGVISGTGGLAKAGGGTLTLAGVNSYSGSTSINAGTLVAAYATALGTTAGGTTVAPGANLTISNVAIGAEAVTLGGGNALTGTGTASLAGSVTLATADSTITVAGADALTLSGVIGGGSGINKAGTGTLTLSGANTYAGATHINAGTLVASNATALGSTVGGTTVAAGANLSIENVAIGAETLTLNGGNSLTGLQFAQLDGNVTLATADSTITMAGGGSGTDSISLLGVISGGFGLNKVGTGELRLLGTNTYTGATTIGEGRLSLVSTGTIAASSGVTVAPSAAFEVSGSTTIDSLSGFGETRLLGGATVLTIGDASNTSSTYAGVLNGTGSLAKAGGGTLTLSGANTYEGVTSINAGTLVAAHASALGDTSNTTTVAAGANLTIANVAIGPQAVSLDGGTLTGTGSASLAGNLSLTANSAITVSDAPAHLKLSGAVAAPSAALTIAGAGSLTAANPANDFSSVTVGGANNVQIHDSNNLTLGASTLSGALTATAGGSIAVIGSLSAGAAGDAITLSGSRFVNSAGAAALSAPNGRWLVWSGNPDPFAGATPDVADGLIPAFKQYNAAHGTTPVLGAGNGFLYSLVPILTPSLAGTVSKVYDGNTTATLVAGHLTASGAVGGDTPVLNAAGASYGDRNAGSGKTVTATGITASASNGSVVVYGYTLSPDSASGSIGEITPAALTVAAIGAVATPYRTPAATGAVTLKGVVAGDAVSSTAGIVSQAFSSSGNLRAGGYTQTATTLVGNDAGNYTLAPFTTPGANYNVAQLALTGTIAAAGSVYAAAVVPGALSLSGVVPGDVVTGMPGVNTAAVSSSGHPVVGSYTQSLAAISGADAANYSFAGFTTPSANYSITPLALSGTIAGASSVYAAAVVPGALSLSGVVAGDLVTGMPGVNTAAVSSSGHPVVGSYTQTATTLAGNDAANYSIAGFTTPIANYSITSLALSGTIAAASSVYAAAQTPGAVSFGNVVAGDVVSSTARVNTTTLSSSGHPVIGNYTQTAGAIGGADAGNYSFAGFTTASANYGITPLALGLDLHGQGSKVYDGTTALTPDGIVPTLSGVVAGDVVSANVNNFLGRFIDKHVGVDKLVVFSGITIAGADAGNYNLFPGGARSTADITPAALTLSAVPTTKVYDGTTTSTGTVGSAGLVAGDTVTGLTQSFASRNVLGANGSTINVNAGYTLDDGNGGANYAVTSHTAPGTITPASLSGSITAGDKVYDSTTAAVIAGRSLAGVIGGDVVGYSGGTASFADKDAGVGKTVTASGLGLTGADAGNYTVNATTSALASITPAALSITADDASKLFAAPNPLFTATYAGLVAGETPAVLGGTLSFRTPAVTASPPGAYPVTPYGQSSRNYTIGYVDGTLVVIGMPVGPVGGGAAAADQQAIGAAYTSQVTPDLALPRICYLSDEDREGDRAKSAPECATDQRGSVIRVVRGGILLPAR